MKFDPASCCQMSTGQSPTALHAAVTVGPASTPALTPWLSGAIPIIAATILRVSGQNRSAHRGCMPPWL
jgi:hypothetical protein